MLYYLDCEFDSFGGPLISLALVREDNESIYITYKPTKEQEEDGYTPWVADNVIPLLKRIPSPFPGMPKFDLEWDDAARVIKEFLDQDKEVPTIIADWPDDISYFCKALMVGPGQMVSVPQVNFICARVYAYPTKLDGAVRHNSYWDAKALQFLHMGLNK